MGKIKNVLTDRLHVTNSSTDDNDIKRSLALLDDYKRDRVRVSILKQDLRAIDSVMGSIKTAVCVDENEKGVGLSHVDWLNMMIDKKLKLTQELEQVQHFVNHVEGILTVMRQISDDYSYLAFKKRYLDGKSTILISHEIPYSYEWVRAKSKEILHDFAWLSRNVNRMKTEL